MSDHRNAILSLIDRHFERLLAEWLANQKRNVVPGEARQAAETADLARRFLEQLRRCVGITEFDNIQAAQWQPVRELLEIFPAIVLCRASARARPRSSCSP
jgi:RsbT co-antagonist protein rsbRD N-terminal domain